MRLVHITDPHLTDLGDYRPGPGSGKRWLSWLSWIRKRRFHHRREQLDRLVEQLAGHQPDLFLVTGDCCQIGLPQEIDQAREWLDELNQVAPVMLVPGNHDIFAEDSITPVQQSWSRYFHANGSDPIWPARLTIGPVSILGLNSALPTAPLLASGQIGKAAMQATECMLQELEHQFRIVMLHHPPIEDLTPRRKALRDDHRLSRVLQDAGAELVLHGHMHCNLRHELKRKDGQTLPVFCTASASSTHSDHPASARLFEVKKLQAESECTAWRVDMQLLSMDPSGQLKLVERDQWQINQGPESSGPDHSINT